MSGRRRLGFEMKRSASPGLTPSMRIAVSDLKLSRLVVVYAGSESYRLGGKVLAVPLADIGRAF